MSKRKTTSKSDPWLVPIIVTLITVIGSVTVAFINIQQAETKVRQELQPTISALETVVARPTATPFTQTQTNLCNYYGFEISEPAGGYILENGQARISGTVRELPPYGSIRLMTIADSTPVSYWPQSLVTVDPSTKEWNGVIHSPYDTTAAVVVLGDDGQILFDYFRKAADTATSQDAQYPGLTQLMKDVQTCKKVTVRKP